MKLTNLNEIKYNKEIKKPLKSLLVVDHLNPKIWNFDGKLNKDVSDKLIQIADDVWDSFDVDFKYDYILFTGSLCSYNWSNYSDIDLHIVFDFKKMNKDVELVSNYVFFFKKEWNKIHNIKIYGYDIEIGIQDIDEKLDTNAEYDVTNDEWLKEPKEYEYKPNMKKIRRMALKYMSRVDYIIDNYSKLNYKFKKEILDDIWDKIKEGRKESLKKFGEMGEQNLVFKILRRNGYIEKIVELKSKVYDEKMSLK